MLKTFLVQAFVIPSGSMEQTIKIGDRVLVDKLTPWFGAKPERGDVVVFKDPGGWLEDEHKPSGDAPVGVKQAKQFLTFIGLLPSADEQDLIKRVVAVGGDTVRCCDKDGRITVNDTPIDEPYVHPDNAPSKLKFTVRVPPGAYLRHGRPPVELGRLALSPRRRGTWHDLRGPGRREGRGHRLADRPLAAAGRAGILHFRRRRGCRSVPRRAGLRIVCLPTLRFLRKRRD